MPHCPQKPHPQPPESSHRQSQDQIKTCRTGTVQLLSTPRQAHSRMSRPTRKPAHRKATRRTLRRQKEKKTLPRATASVSRFCCVTAQLLTCPSCSPGILTRFPFAPRQGPLSRQASCRPPKHRHPKAPAGRTTAKKITCLASAPSERQRYRLGVTNPRPIAVLAEPFVSSALSVLMKVSATTTKICKRGCSTGLHSHRFCAHPTHLSGSRPRNQVPDPLWGGCNKKTSSPSYSTPTFLKLYWGVG